jgi:hypothetical protein
MANRLNQFNPVSAGFDLLDGSGNFLTDELPSAPVVTSVLPLMLALRLRLHAVLFWGMILLVQMIS